jgi:hypothetical protein
LSEDGKIPEDQQKAVGRRGGETARRCREISESLVEASKRRAAGEGCCSGSVRISELFKWIRFYFVGKEYDRIHGDPMTIDAIRSPQRDDRMSNRGVIPVQLCNGGQKPRIE